MSLTRTRKTLIAVATGATLFGITFASAASLGGVNSKSLGAGDTIVASCDTDGVNIDYNHSYDPTNGQYQVENVTISDISENCENHTLEVTLADTQGTALATGTTTITTTSETVTLTTTPSAEAVTNAHIIITG
ncbi:MAG: hypothetical protein WC184_11570 [Acidimicrobiia bacterium]